MAVPTFKPVSTVSRIILPATGSTANVVAALPFSIYTASAAFISGAADQVAYTYRKLGGDVLDLEVHEKQIYTAYQEAVLEYGYIVNLHQGGNILSNVLGTATASFDEDGTILTGPQGANLKYPQFDFSYTRRIADGISEAATVGGNNNVYSASFSVLDGVQDYDLQTVVSSSSAAGGVEYAGLVGNEKILINKVYYHTPRAIWRFYGYYGGINTVGNLSTYGQFADDSTFEVIPVWQNKMQAMAYKDAVYTRLSHYSYELRNNRLRIYPIPYNSFQAKFWFEFTVKSDPLSEDGTKQEGLTGVNNLNSIPFDNLPYANVNAIGKQWIRRYAFAVAKEMLGYNRSKLDRIPIPNNEVTLNGEALMSQAKEEQDKLREELKTILDTLTYNKLVESDSNMVNNGKSLLESIPILIYRG